MKKVRNDLNIPSYSDISINIPELVDAENPGMSDAHNCTLILTEGESVKKFSLLSFEVVGNKNWGVYPIRGKILNIQDASESQISENKEIKAIEQALGLRHRKYESLVDLREDLRYGKLMIMTDQDFDGSHIKGLIISFFAHFYPLLLEQSEFLQIFVTPIVKYTKNNNTISLYTLPEYKDWKRQNSNRKGWTIKYYKSLGTITTDEAEEYFSDLNKHIKRFKQMDKEDHRLVEMAFTKKNADKCKIWIRGIQ